jgi:DNA-binding transcriptional regulator YiaG
MTPWTGKRIQQLRQQLGETTATFGQRLGRSGRTIEDWEQGRRTTGPDLLAQRELEKIAREVTK